MKGYKVVIADDPVGASPPTFKSKGAAVHFARAYAKLGHDVRVVRNKTGELVAEFSKE